MEIKDEMQQYFEGLNAEITLYPDITRRKFTKFIEFYEFIENEMKFWEECSSSNKVAEIINRFRGIKSQLDTAIQNFNPSNNYYSSNIDSAISQASINQFPVLYSTSAYSVLIKDRHAISPFQADAVIEFLIGSNMTYYNNIEYFKGLMFAFNWKESEAAFTSYLDTTDQSFNSIKAKQIETMSILHAEYLEKNREVNNTYQAFSNEMNIWKTTTEENTKEFINTKKTVLEDLEKTYKEKLSLEAPAKYWDDLYKEYKDTGEQWRNWAIGTSIVLMILLTAILYNFPNSLNVNIKNLNVESLKGTLILAIIVSIGVYMLRLFVKLSISAYHLSRDAKERYQLTYVYLALLKDNAVSENNKSIVLQSLFSRADTGLLKGDSSPTLPEGLIQQAGNLIAK